MVFDKIAKQCGIFAIRGNCADHIIQVANTSARGLKSIEQLVVANGLDLLQYCRPFGSLTWGSSRHRPCNFGNHRCKLDSRQRFLQHNIPQPRYYSSARRISGRV